MDTLSTSISTFTIPQSNLKTHLHHHHPSIPSTTKPKTTKLSNKTSVTFTTQNHFVAPHISSSRSSSPLKHSPNSKPHHSPSTGYAVALLDAARRHNAVDAVSRDVRRLSRWLRNDQLRGVMGDPLTDKAAKGEIVKEVVRQGRFEKHLVKLVKLLAEKAKVDLLGQVLSEFGKIYDELSVCSNHQVLLLPYGMKMKMEENKILEIIGRVQRVTGADKVTVRELLDPRFA
ncbi:ATP synthase delta chain, chloroplastic [Salvia miltiorrhiza]|uniref:ATP synthase delta chain, chloroplastic n=1 Tax=Salvia miltiorrhiza TaxID=226208 RepID=UPI0025ABAF5F|nr:ATP synthase delta chain, chloroplastic [Salvia miltiorrhiza]